MLIFTLGPARTLRPTERLSRHHPSRCVSSSACPASSPHRRRRRCPASPGCCARPARRRRTGTRWSTRWPRDFGVERRGDWPLAALRLRALGLDPGRDWWLAADPVTLVAGRDDVRLAGPVVDLAATEADGADRRAQRALRRRRPRASSPRPPAPGSSAARDATRSRRDRWRCAIGAPLRALLPEGPASRTWRRWGNEIEMLLHEHPVNRAREARGTRRCQRPVVLRRRCAAGAAAAAIGGGHLRRRRDGARTRRARGNAARDACRRDLDAARGATPAAAARFVVLAPAHRAPATSRRAWTAPAWRALAAGALDAVGIVADGGGRALRWTAHRPGIAARASRCARGAAGAVRPAAAAASDER